MNMETELSPCVLSRSEYWGYHFLWFFHLTWKRILVHSSYKTWTNVSSSESKISLKVIFMRTITLPLPRPILFKYTRTYRFTIILFLRPQALFYSFLLLVLSCFNRTHLGVQSAHYRQKLPYISPKLIMMIHNNKLGVSSIYMGDSYSV